MPRGWWVWFKRVFSLHRINFKDLWQNFGWWSYFSSDTSKNSSRKYFTSPHLILLKWIVENWQEHFPRKLSISVYSWLQILVCISKLKENLDDHSLAILLLLNSRVCWKSYQVNNLEFHQSIYFCQDLKILSENSARWNFFTYSTELLHWKLVVASLSLVKNSRIIK